MFVVATNDENYPSVDDLLALLDTHHFEFGIELVVKWCTWIGVYVTGAERYLSYEEAGCLEAALRDLFIQGLEVIEWGTPAQLSTR